MVGVTIGAFVILLVQGSAPMAGGGLLIALAAVYDPRAPRRDSTGVAPVDGQPA